MLGSTSSEADDFVPIGIGMLSLGMKEQGASVMAGADEEEDSDLPPFLRYRTLLDRAMAALAHLREENAERLRLPLSVVRKSRKTYVNVQTIARILHQQRDHLSHFLTKGLFASGSTTRDGTLVLDGSYLQSEVETILRQFIDLYVVCKVCDSVEDTYITKENKLFFVCCDRCRGRRCVGGSIDGFVLRDRAGGADAQRT